MRKSAGIVIKILLSHSKRSSNLVDETLTPTSFNANHFHFNQSDMKFKKIFSADSPESLLTQAMLH